MRLPHSSINVTTNVLTVVDGPSAVSLSSATSIVEGGTASSSITFSLDKAAVGGFVTLTPSGKACGVRARSHTVAALALSAQTPSGSDRTRARVCVCSHWHHVQPFGDECQLGPDCKCVIHCNRSRGDGGGNNHGLIGVDWDCIEHRYKVRLYMQ